MRLSCRNGEVVFDELGESVWPVKRVRSAGAEAQMMPRKASVADQAQ